MNDITPDQLGQAARVLSDSLPWGYAAPEDAMREIKRRLVPENTMLAVVSEGEVVALAGMMDPTYDGRVFELHPLAVRSDRRGRGMGRALVTALEDAARSRGGVVMWLGADDDSAEGETTLAGVDLFDDLPGRLANFKPGTHQAGFYMKLGYGIIGVMPEASGPGKPDIYMAKRL